MPKASRTKLRQHAPAAQLPFKRSFAAVEASEQVLPGSAMTEEATTNAFDLSAPGPSRKKGFTVPLQAPALPSHPYSRSHARREKRKTKQNLHGGTLDTVAEALLSATGIQPEDGDGTDNKVSTGKKAERQAGREKERQKLEKGSDGMIGEGKGRTMREKARRKQIKIEGMRIPAIMKHPEYKKDPWATIRLHASNTLESSNPTAWKGYISKRVKVAPRIASDHSSSSDVNRSLGNLWNRNIWPLSGRVEHRQWF